MALHEDGEDDAAAGVEERSMQCRPLKFFDRDGAAAVISCAHPAMPLDATVAATAMHGVLHIAVAIADAIAGGEPWRLFSPALALSILVEAEPASPHATARNAQAPATAPLLPRDHTLSRKKLGRCN